MTEVDKKNGPKAPLGEKTHPEGKESRLLTCPSNNAAMPEKTEGVWFVRAQCLLDKLVPRSAFRFIPVSKREERLQVKAELAFSKKPASHKGPGHTGPRN